MEPKHFQTSNNWTSKAAGSRWMHATSRCSNCKNISWWRILRELSWLSVLYLKGTTHDSALHNHVGAPHDAQWTNDLEISALNRANWLEGVYLREIGGQIRLNLWCERSRKNRPVLVSIKIGLYNFGEWTSMEWGIKKYLHIFRERRIVKI